MSTQPNDGGPAFPHFKTGPNGLVEICPQGGMSLRDWFAGQALAGVLALDDNMGPVDFSTPAAVARFSYQCADAMLAARELKEDAT